MFYFECNQCWHEWEDTGENPFPESCPCCGSTSINGDYEPDEPDNSQADPLDPEVIDPNLLLLH